MFVSLLPRLTLFAEPKQLDEEDLLGLTFSCWAGAFAFEIDYRAHRCGKLFNQFHEIEHF